MCSHKVNTGVTTRILQELTESLVITIFACREVTTILIFKFCLFFIIFLCHLNGIISFCVWLLLLIIFIFVRFFHVTGNCNQLVLISVYQYEYTIIYLSILWLMDIRGGFQVLIITNNTIMKIFEGISYIPVHPFWLGIFLGGELLGHRIYTFSR